MSNNLAQYRKRAQMTQEDLGEIMGTTKHTVFAWEHEKSHPRAYQIRRMADVLGCTIEELNLEPHKSHKTVVKSGKIYTQRTDELNDLMQRIDAFGYRCLREVEAYLSPEPEREIIHKIRAGFVTDDELDRMREIVERYES